MSERGISMRPVVLLVDDDPKLLMGLRRALRGEPFDVRLAVGAYEALSHMKAWGGVDVLITDQHMPGMTGTALLAAVRERYPDTARFMLTGSPSLAVAVDAINSGSIHRFFVKPCDPRELAAAARAALHDRMIAAAARVSSGPMLLVDVSRGLIAHGNEAAEQLFGLGAAALQERALADLIDGDPGESAREAREFLALPPPASRRWRMLGRERAPIEAEVSLHPFAAGSAATACIAIRNIGEVSRLEAEVTQLQRAEILGELVGGVAHDLGNLLMVINGRSELLAASHGDVDAVKRTAEVIHATAKRGSSLTRQLLAYLHGSPAADAIVDLNAVMTGAADLLEKIVGRHIAIELDLDPGAGQVRGDVTQIEQIAMNLGLNARDAMPDGGTLRLRTWSVDGSPGEPIPPGRYVALQVSDTGVGMPPEVCRRAFEPFYTTKGPGKGTGLGLPTVARIADLHGGHIGLDSEPGRGTTFTVYLPKI